MGWGEGGGAQHVFLKRVPPKGVIGTNKMKGEGRKGVKGVVKKGRGGGGGGVGVRSPASFVKNLSVSIQGGRRREKNLLPVRSAGRSPGLTDSLNPY